MKRTVVCCAATTLLLAVAACGPTQTAQPIRPDDEHGQGIEVLFNPTDGQAINPCPMTDAVDALFCTISVMDTGQ